MSSVRSDSIAAPERRAVITTAELLALGAAVIVVCWLIFPRDLADSLRSSEMDAVSLSYSNAWLRAEPNDFPLRLLLAEELIELGRFDEAYEQLDYVAANAGSDRFLLRRQWLQARMPFVALMAVPPEYRHDDPLQEQALEALLALRPADLDYRQLERYAEMALILGRPDRAVAAYHQLAERQDNPAGWYRRAGDAFLARGRYQDAAREYLLAMGARAGTVGARDDFLTAMATLQAGGYLDQALREARRHERAFLADNEVLFRLMKLAQAAGNAERAEYYASLLLRLRDRLVPGATGPVEGQP